VDKDKITLKKNIFFFTRNLYIIYILLKYFGYIILELQAYLNDMFRIEQSLAKRKSSKQKLDK